MTDKNENESEVVGGEYEQLHGEIASLLEQARRTAARSINSIMTATYWEIGRRIVETEQGGESRAEYGKALLKQLSKDLGEQFGRGFSVANLERMRRFFLFYSSSEKSATVSRISGNLPILQRFPLP